MNDPALRQIEHETRDAIKKDGVGSLEIDDLRPQDLPRIAWSGSPTHIENVERQLGRTARGEVEYLAARSPSGWPIAKCAIDYTQHKGAGTMFQLATLRGLRGLGIARRLISEAEKRIERRGLNTAMLGVENDNARARNIYERLGYAVCGEENESWESEDAQGNRYIKQAHITLLKRELLPPVLRGSTLRPTISPELFEVLTAEYGITSREAKELEGSSNLNALVEAEGRRYVIRLYRSWTSEERLSDIHLAHETLEKGGVPSRRLVKTQAGQGWSRVGEWLLEVEEFIDHDADMDSWRRLEMGLPWLGRVHDLLRPLELSPDGMRAPAHNNIEHGGLLAAVQGGTKRIRGWRPSLEEARLAEEAEELAVLVTGLEKHLVPRLPRQLVHGDFWDNNVLFRGRDVVLVADLDFMGERPRIDDLALTLFYTNSRFTEDQTSEARARRLRRLTDAYESRLEEGLSGVERSAFLPALLRIPLAFIAMIALIDSEEGAKKHAAGRLRDVQWALSLARQPAPWAAIFGEA